MGERGPDPFTALPCNDFVEILASKAAIAGGGGASAPWLAPSVWLWAIWWAA